MQTIFQIDKISKTYRRGDRTFLALDEVSLFVEKGDVYGIIGLSGAGKSTLIRCLAALVKPNNGEVLFDSRNIGTMGRGELRDFRKKIGMIFQHFNLLSSRTVGGNVAYPLEIAQVSKEKQKERVDELLDLVGLSQKKGSYPSELSGGEKQRVGIARALANHPEVLLCDEATSALDPKTTREILALLRNINKKLGVTIILITHEMDVIRQLCTKVAVIEKGKIVEEGSILKVFGDPEHPTTKHFLQHASHEIPSEFFKGISPNRKFLRLRFKGGVAGEPVMAEIVRKFNVDVNILQGWIDRVQTLSVGTLIVELLGDSLGIERVLGYLAEKGIQYEVIEHEL
jgi:D-methionine transport system ATP-binding protein